VSQEEENAKYENGNREGKLVPERKGESPSHKISYIILLGRPKKEKTIQKRVMHR
jgi:hypothetical protein